MDHIVYCDAKAKVLEKLLNGTKTMVIRGAAGRKLPHGRVFAGEQLYFIENNGSGMIKAIGTVGSVFNSEKMTEEESVALVEQYAKKLDLTEEQYKRWAGKKYLCLVAVKNLEPIEPLILDRQNNMDDWIIVEDIKTLLR